MRPAFRGAAALGRCGNAAGTGDGSGPTGRGVLPRALQMHGMQVLRAERKKSLIKYHYTFKMWS